MQRAKKQEQQLEVALPPENILKDDKKFGEILDLKLVNTPRTIPDFLDAIAEKNPALLQNPVIIQVLAEKIQTLLQTVAKDSSLSGDRDWMDKLRQSIQRVIISPDVYKKIDTYGTMEQPLRDRLQSQLGIEGITADLDKNTQDIVRRVHTGFYQFDTGINGWVNSLGAHVFLWPENIAGIKTYLRAVQPNHPFLSVTNYHSNDKEGKYAFQFTGSGHNMALAEADYLQHYLAERAKDAKMTHEQIVGKLAQTHAVTTGSQSAVDAFEKTYGRVNFLKESPKGTLVTQNIELSKNILPTEQYLKLTQLINPETSEKQKKYEKILRERPEMRDIIYDIAGGFIRFDTDLHRFETATRRVIRFTDAELSMVDEVFQKFQPNYPFLIDRNINTIKKSSKLTPEEKQKILEERINYYQQ